MAPTDPLNAVAAVWWLGEYRGKPAISLSRYGTAELWVWDAGEWNVEKTATTPRELEQLINPILEKGGERS